MSDVVSGVLGSKSSFLSVGSPLKGMALGGSFGG